MIALFLATFEFAMLFTNKNKKLSLVVTMLVTFAPTVHWWFAVNNLVEMIVFAEVAIVLIDRYLYENNFKKKIIFSLGVMLCAGNYMFCTYPAWLIPTTYIFLPFLVWVFYKNRKNIKLTKKDLIILVFELLILIGLVLRILIKSKDVIEIILNTAYPGKRISSKGEINCLLELITSNINLFLPYTDKIENPCEIAVFVDFFPIMLVLLIYSIAKNKIKDFLLYFMIGVSIFLNIYCIFGFPVWLAKITLMSYSLANRVKGVVGLINIFILARLLTINEKNIFSKNKSAIISIIISIIIGICIKAVYSKEFYIWQIIVTCVLSAIIYFLILQAKDRKYEYLLVSVVSIFAIVSVFGVNPLRIGTPIFKSELGNTVKEINSKDPGTWVTSGINGNFLIPFGVNCFNCVNIYPNLPLWYELDVNREYEDIYNRYANVLVEIIKDDDVSFDLVAPDTFHVFCNIDKLSKINIKYICTRELYKNGEVDTLEHKLTKITKKDSLYIYKIEPIGE